MAEIGLRVVRGPDWKWGNQDGGEGHVGTVIEIGQAGSPSSSPEKTVVVQWDFGSRTNYRIGYQDAYDLRKFDNAPLGVKHPNIICNACRKHGFSGIRWKCSKCFDFDLCTQCYMADKHDLGHVFTRYEDTTSVGVPVPKRQGAVKVQAKGIFVGAKVVRGPDWDWGNQDGGDGNTGRVIDVRGWDNESSRSVANVTWTSGSTNVYRLGHKGKVDLKYVQEASGGFYYRDHLPVVGREVDRLPVSSASLESTSANVTRTDAHATVPANAADQVASSSSAPTVGPFLVGDRVKVVIDVDVLRAKQEGHGGWNPRMAEYVGKVGLVHRVTERGDIRVQYDGCNNNRWTFHPAALAKVTAFSVGDVVRINSDVQKVKELQRGHGEWIDVMKWTLGKTGKVLKVYSDGDLRIKVNGNTWTYNAECVCLAHDSTTDLNNTMSSDEGDEQTALTAPLLAGFLEQQPSDSMKGVGASGTSGVVGTGSGVAISGGDRLVREAAQGHVDAVRNLSHKWPQLVDTKSSGKTALQVAAHMGQLEIVKMLLAAGAHLELQDDDGDTALHYSAFGNQPEVMEYLLKRGAHVDAVNRGKCSTLHVAVNKQHVQCVRVLLRHGCNVNVQDAYGDTALHDAIGKESRDIVELLVNVAAADFTLRNKRGFNVLHHAALKGNNFATEKLLAKSRQIVDVKKDDGFAALHLAALNGGGGHRLVAETLLTQGQCEIDIKNNRKQTPLLLAVSSSSCSLIELLVTMGANVNAEDEDMDTGLHLALMRQRTGFADVNEMEAPTVHMILEDLHAKGIDRNVGLAVACYLAQENGDLTHRNRQGKTPLDLLTDLAHKDIIQDYAALRSVPWNLSSTLPMTTTTTATRGDGDAISSRLESGVGDGDEDGREAGEGRSSMAVAPECTICCEALAGVVFEPCGHQVACVECCTRMKKCIACQVPITSKTNTGGRLMASRQTSSQQQQLQQQLQQQQHQQQLQQQDDDGHIERMKYLENKIQEIEEASGCSICMERRRNVAFLCGHGACAVCAHTLKTCHMCRKPITKKINLY